ncbi:MAG TPA: GGDEF domain-containing protein [Nocardioides sp.]|nr:GGDEF domain-containing protein [Nocardioides sp.]
MGAAVVLGHRRSPEVNDEVAVELEQARETAGVTMRLIVDHVRRECGEDGVRRLLAEAGETRPLSVLEDEGVWSSYDAKIRLFEAAARVTGRSDVARRIGEGALASSVGSSVKLLIGLVGSPAQVVRGISRAHGKFSTAAEMVALDVERDSAVVRYRVHDRHPPSAHDCGYTAGLLSQVPVLFGLPPATVRHDVCQVTGAEACLYVLSWQRRGRRADPRSRRGDRSLSTPVVLQRLRDLQETVADLVTDRSVEDVLGAITARARTTVGAQRFLLVARVDEGEPRVEADGFTVREAESVATALLTGEPPDVEGHLIVAPVRSSQRDYGRLAAFGPEAFYDHEEELLRSYAALAATALDAVTALDEVRDRGRFSEVLLGFARELLDAHGVADVADATARAALAVAEADCATVLLTDAGDGSLRSAGQAGWPDRFRDLVAAVSIHPEDTPEMGELTEHPEQPRVYDRTTSDPFIAQVLREFETDCMVVVPLWSGRRLWGIVIAAWLSSAPLVTQTLTGRLTGLADQAVTAFDRAELAEQVQHQATVDPLTGLANRRAFTDALQQVLAGDDPLVERPASAAVVFLDLDRFKEVNDRLGHDAGDQLLVTVARRISGVVRTDDLVARLGGDEFTVLLRSVGSDDELEMLIGRVCQALARPVALEGLEVETPPSVGAVRLGSAHATVRDVLRDADAAMYAAKKSGGRTFVVHPHQVVR